MMRDGIRREPQSQSLIVIGDWRDSESYVVCCFGVWSMVWYCLATYYMYMNTYEYRRIRIGVYVLHTS